MKFTTALLMLLLLSGCDNNEEKNDQHSGSTGNVEEYSGDNISPQLENENDTMFEVDTISGPADAKDQKDGELE